MNSQESSRLTSEDCIKKYLALQWDLEHCLGNDEWCPTLHIINYFKCGIATGKFRQCIHSASDHYGLGKEEKNIFHRSDLDYSGNFQNFFALFINFMFICI